MNDELKPLSKKHQRFVAEYLKCFNGTRAYMKVYPKASVETAMANASDLLRNTKVSAAIDERKDRVLMQADEAMNLLSEHARGDMADLMDITPMGFTLNLKKAAENGKTKLIKEIEQKVITVNGEKEDREIITTRLKLHDPQAAIEKILKVHGKIKPDSYEIVIRYANPNDNPANPTP